MYFDFGDYRPDTPTIEGAISRREGVILSVAAHVVVLALLIFIPQLPWVQEAAREAREAALERARQLEEKREPTRFVFVQPRVDIKAPEAPKRADLSDQDRVAATRERARDPRNSLPYSRGNTPERIESMRENSRAMGRGPAPEPTPPQPENRANNARVEDPNRVDLPETLRPREPDRVVTEKQQPGLTTPPSGGSLGEALKNLQRYVQDQSFNNQEGGGTQIGPFQFDTKGVEFGPWIRRFIAQIKRNWFVPYAAMSLRGHVVLSFNVHKDGSITDLTVVQPSAVDAFTNAAYGALAASNPTQPLPPEYPTDRAFFTVTFYYNENPTTP
jgi:TonB family protein